MRVAKKNDDLLYIALSLKVNMTSLDSLCASAFSNRLNRERRGRVYSWHNGASKMESRIEVADWRKKKKVLFLITLLYRLSVMQVAGKHFLQSS
ncbi:unnamed protein product [Lathyrus oleraceus]